MTTAKGKHLISALSVSGTPRVQLSDADYEALAGAFAYGLGDLVDNRFLFVSPTIGVERQTRLRRTEVGVLPRSLMEQLNLYESICDFIFQQLAPRCSVCDVVALCPATVGIHKLPSDGIIAACVIDDGSSLPLSDRCELLGVERAVVSGHLVRVDDLHDQEGEPVVALLASHEHVRFEAEVARWFARGGGDLRVLHFVDRTHIGSEVGRWSQLWRCPSCGAQLNKPSQQTLAESSPCSGCRGAGWFAVEGGRYTACRDCSGFGSLDPARRSDFGGVELQSVAALTFGEMLRRVDSATGMKGSFRDLAERLHVVCESGLSDYPVGASIDLLSQGERALLSIVAGRLSKFTGVSYVVDGAIFGGATRYDIPRGLQNEIRVAIPHSGFVEDPLPKTDSVESIVLRGVACGPLQIEEVSFPVGAFSLVQGDVGAGKSLLLQMIAERFAKRRKQAHLTAFGAIKRCHALCGAVPHDGVVLDLLGLSTEFAEEIARTKEAKHSGLVAQELELRTSPYRCGECGGFGVTADEVVCGQCDGVLFDWRVAGLEVGGISVGRLLQMSLCDLKGVFWVSDRLSYLIGRFPMQYASDLRLSTPIAALVPEVRRFLRIWGHLIGVASRTHTLKRGVLTGDMVLVDGPGPLMISHLRELSGVLRELTEAGATVIAAGLAESLESHCSSVVRLGFSAGGRADRPAQEMLDTRYARVSGLSGHGR